MRRSGRLPSRQTNHVILIFSLLILQEQFEPLLPDLRLYVTAASVTLFDWSNLVGNFPFVLFQDIGLAMVFRLAMAPYD